MSESLTPCLTPPELAKVERVKPDKIVAEIRAGRLDAHDVASPGSKRPRFRITPEAVAAWRLRRAAVQTTTSKKRIPRPAAPLRSWV